MNNPEQILLIEDDPGAALLCRRKLAKAGYAVSHAPDGDTGLAMQTKTVFDAIVLDHTLPGFDGVEIIRRMLASGMLPPIVMVTGTGNEQVAVEAMRLGARDYVVKDSSGGYLDLLPTTIEKAICQKRAEDAVRLAARVFETVAEGIIILDPELNIVSANPAFTAITGYPLEEVIGRNSAVLRSGRHDATFYNGMLASLADTGNWQGEVWHRRKNGECYPAWLTISSVKDERGNLTNYVAAFTDITAHKQVEEHWRYLASHDALTGLPNRDLLADRLSQTVAIARRSQRQFTLLQLDLDGFKRVNDTFGHTVGDLLLQEVAKRLAASVRDCDTAARVGGDEFIVLLREMSDAGEIEKIVKRILQNLAEPFTLHDHECRVTASIGISLYPDNGAQPDELIKNADAAMYRAKKRHNCYEYSTASPAEAMAVS